MNTLPEPYRADHQEQKNSFELSSFFREIYTPEAQAVMVFFIEEIMKGKVEVLNRECECYHISIDRFLTKFPYYSFEEKKDQVRITKIFEEISSVRMEYKGYETNGCETTWGISNMVSCIGYDLRSGTIYLELRVVNNQKKIEKLHAQYEDRMDVVLLCKIGEERMPGKRKDTPIYKKVQMHSYSGPRYIHPNSKEGKQLKALGTQVHGQIIGLIE